ncbi:MAG: Gfo/Idh/MocA family oxidoreductase [Devosia sp.]|jgi:predicted dehydrogenase|nr:Gfo/Idh/MocA family oxidoreductase [Devosia sp.]OJX49745.1 MAG: NAD-binding protein [Devosia sp. 66-22]
MGERMVRWGIISTAAIGMNQVTPGIMKSPHSEVVALASRDLGKAQAALARLGLGNARAYGSYEELLADPDIDAIYNPLPNHLHVPLTLAAARAGKHVLCEKPMAMSAAEAEELRGAPEGVIISEAFMVRHHPQWHRARAVIRSGELGTVKLVRAVFLYFNRDPANVRNIADIGGGGIYDIGCYCVISGRYLFEAEPRRVVALVDRDPEFGTDRLASVIADFGGGRQLSFVCGTQNSGRQSVEAIGDKGSLEIVIPFNAPIGQKTALLVGNGGPMDRSLHRREIIPEIDQYTEQAENFALAVLGRAEAAYGVEDAILQMRVLDAIFRSEASGGWENVR